MIVGPCAQHCNRVEHGPRFAYWHTGPASTSVSQQHPSAWDAASWLNGSSGVLATDISVPAGKLASVGADTWRDVVVAEAFAFASTLGFHQLRIDGEVLGNLSTYLFEPGASDHECHVPSPTQTHAYD